MRSSAQYGTPDANSVPPLTAFLQGFTLVKRLLNSFADAEVNGWRLRLKSDFLRVLLFQQSDNLRIRKDPFAMCNCPGKEKAQTRCALFLFTAINN
jgi:hypothetical protein